MFKNYYSLNKIIKFLFRKTISTILDKFLTFSNKLKKYIYGYLLLWKSPFNRKGCRILSVDNNCVVRSFCVNV